MKRSWLKDYRTRLNITQEELSARLNVSGIEVTPGAVSHWETGRYKPPLNNSEFRNALAAILKISPQELLAAAGYETEQTHTEDGERAAFLVDQLPSDAKSLALDYLDLLARRYTKTRS